MCIPLPLPLLCDELVVLVRALSWVSCSPVERVVFIIFVFTLRISDCLLSNSNGPVVRSFGLFLFE